MDCRKREGIQANSANGLTVSCHRPLGHWPAFDANGQLVTGTYKLFGEISPFKAIFWGGGGRGGAGAGRGGAGIKEKKDLCHVA